MPFYNRYKNQFQFSGDMSQDRDSNVIDLGDCRHLNVTIQNPATGAPVGAYSVWVGNDSTAMVEYQPGPSVQPSGGAFELMMDQITTNAFFVQLKYKRTSGGAGANIVASVAMRP